MLDSNGEIYIGGKRYVSSYRCGDISSYTNDHVSRLCRLGKLDAKKIEGSWYVTEESLRLYMILNKVSEKERNQILSEKIKRRFREKELVKPIRDEIGQNLEYISQSFKVARSFGSKVEPSSPSTSNKDARNVVSPYQTLRVFFNSQFSKKLVALSISIALIFGTAFASQSDEVRESLASGTDRAIAFGKSVFAGGQYAFSEPEMALGTFSKLVTEAQKNGGSFLAFVFDSGLKLFAQNFNNLVDNGASNLSLNFLSWIKGGDSVTSNIYPTEEIVNEKSVAPKVKSTQSQSPLVVTGTTKIVERLTERIISGVSSEELDLKLQQLNNKLSGEIYRLSPENNGLSGYPSGVFTVASQANRIDKLTNTVINTPTISGGSWSDATVSGTLSGTFSGNISGTTTFAGGATTTFSNGFELSAGCVYVNGSCLGSGSGNVGSGTAGQFAYYETSGSTLTATSSIVISALSNIGIGTSSPYGKLSVVGDVVAAYFSATTSATSTFAGGFDSLRLKTSATSTLAGLRLSTGGLTISTLNCSTFTNGGTLTTDSNGNVTCDDDGGGGGGADGNWSFFNGSGIKLATTTNQVLIGGSSTTSLAQLEVQGRIYSSGFLGIATTSPFAALSVVGNGFISGTLSLANISATGTLSVSGLSSLADVTFANATGTSFFATTASSTRFNTLNATSSQSFFSALGTFTKGLFTDATTTSLSVSNLASTSQLVASNSFTFSNVSGFLKATAGVVATSLINLASDITGILTVPNGGTGWAAIQSGTIPYGNGSSALSTTTAGTAGNILSLLNGVPTWTASTTFSSGLSYSGGNVTNTGLLSLAQSFGSAQTGAITLATSSATSFNGLTLGQTITNSAGTFTFTPTLSGTLSVAGGGTGAATFSYGLISSQGGTGALVNIATSSLGLLSTNVAEGSNLYYLDSRVQSFIHASTTIPKTYTTNTFTGNNTFTEATSTSFFATTASSTRFNTLNATSSQSFFSALGTFTKGLFTDATTTSLFATTASTSALYVTGLSTCDATTGKITYSNGTFNCGTDFNTGGGGATDFTFQTHFDANTAATSSPVYFSNNLSASSTVRFGLATKPLFYFDSANGFLGLGTTTFSTGNILSIYGGTTTIQSPVNGLVFDVLNSASTSVFSIDTRTGATTTSFFATTASSTRFNTLNGTSSQSFFSNLIRATTGLFTDATTTSLFATTASSTQFNTLNATSSQSFFSSLVRATVGLFTDATSTSLFATTASTSALYVTGLSTCDSTTGKITYSNGTFNCGTDFNTGGGGGSAFTFQTHFDANTAATSSPVYFSNNLSASSTVRFGLATKPMFYFDSTNGFLGLGTTTFSTGNILSIYGGTTTIQSPVNGLVFDVLNSASTSVFSVDTRTGATTTSFFATTASSTRFNTLNGTSSQSFFSALGTFTKGLFTDATTTSLFATTASTSALYVTGLSTCDATTGKITYSNGTFNCGTDFNTGGGGATDFTFQTHFDANTAATSSPVYFSNNLSASSTVRFGIATKPLFYFDSTNGFLGLGTTTYSVGNILSIYGGTTTIQTPINGLVFDVLNSASTSVFSVDTRTGATTTSFFASTASSTRFNTLNGTSSQSFFSTLGTFTKGLFTDATSTSFFSTTASSTNLFFGNATGTTLFASVASSTQFNTLNGTSSQSFFSSLVRATVGLFTDATTTSLFATTASTSALYVTGLSTCDSTTGKITYSNGTFNCGTDFNTGGGGGSAFTFQTHFDLNTAATSSPVYFSNNLSASSTVRFGIATKPLFYFDSANGFLGLGTTTFSAGNILSIYGGTTTIQSPVNGLVFDVLNSASTSVFSIDTRTGATSTSFFASTASSTRFNTLNGTSSQSFFSALGTFTSGLFTNATTSSFAVTGTATTTFGGPIVHSSGDFIVARGGTGNLLLNPYGGNVGIGTSTPFAKFALSLNSTDSAYPGNNAFIIASSTASATTTLFSVDNTGLTTIGNSSGTGDAVFQFAADTNAWSLGYYSTDKTFRIASSTNLTSNAYFQISKSGTTTLNSAITSSNVGQYLCIDATTFQILRNNTACAPSSVRFKENIADMEYGLDTILKLRPVTFTFKESMNFGTTTQLGFIAEEVEGVLPEIVAYGNDGLPSGLNYPLFTAVLTKAFQEMHLNIATIASTTASSTPASQSFAASFMNNIFARLTQWFADTANGISEFVATRLRAKEEICVDDQCLTRDDVRALIDIARNGQAAAAASPAPEPDPAPAEEPTAEVPPVEEAPAEVPVVESAPEPVVAEPTPEPTPEPVAAEPVAPEASPAEL